MSFLKSLKPLKIIFQQIESYNDQSQYFSEIITLWKVLHNQAVTKGIDKINKQTTAASISTFDFSTFKQIFLTGS